MDVGGWLRGLGLGQYEEKFRDNKIDADLLPRLTVDDLKDIGVSVVGDRRRLLDAIAVIAERRSRFPDEVCSIQGPSGIGRAPSDHSHVLRPRRLDEPGRKARRRGLAQSRQRLSRRGFGGGDRSWRPCVEEARRRADGAVRLSAARRRTTPSALCAPRSRSSARSPTSTQGTPDRARRSFPPASASSPGRSSSTPAAKCSAKRRTSRRASRLQPNLARCSSPSTFSARSPGSSSSRSKGAHELKGVAQPLSLYRVVRASGGGRRGGARALTPFVGREEELGLLARRWERARAGEGQLVLDRRRTGARQIAADRGVPRAARGNAAHLGRMERLAAFAEHAAASNRRMGPAAFWRWMLLPNSASPTSKTRCG